MCDSDPQSPVHRLGLLSPGEWDAFLELYGFWLGAGSLSYATPPSLVFRTMHNEQLLIRLLRQAGLVGGVDWCQTASSNGTHQLRVFKQSWFSLFDEEYWIQYCCGRLRRASQSWSDLVSYQQICGHGENNVVADAETSADADAPLGGCTPSASEAVRAVPARSERIRRAPGVSQVVHALGVGTAWS
jgi:hypothetical protein